MKIERRRTNYVSAQYGQPISVLVLRHFHWSVFVNKSLLFWLNFKALATYHFLTTSYRYTKSLMTVPLRYFRQAEFNGYLKPLLSCNISFYTSYTFIINTYNATRRN